MCTGFGNVENEGVRQIAHLAVFAAPFSAFLAFAGVAQAAGGAYVFDGGTASQQRQVRSALEASSFNWSLVTQQITIKIARIGRDYAIPDTIFLDSDLLNAPGDYSWGVVQNEYANEVQFFLLPEQARATFNSALGGTAWCYEDQPGLSMTQYGCERFASTLAWSYWQSPGNCINPTDTGGISGGMAPAAFRALLTGVLGTKTETKPALALPVSVKALSAETTQAASARTVGETPVGARGIRSVKKPGNKIAKAVFSAPLRVSVQRQSPAA